MRALQRHEQGLFLAAAGLVIAIVSLAPLARLAGELSAGAESLGVLLAPRVWFLLVRSILLSSATVLTALAIGLPMAVIFGALAVPFRRTLWVIHGFPMFLPPFLLALGWFHLLGRQGLVGSETTARFLFSEAGLVAVLGVTLAPVVSSLTALGILGVDPSLKEAAAVVARPWRVAVRILLPAAAPAIALSTILVFTLALSELGVAMFLRVDVYPAAVFARLGGVDFAPGEAFVLAFPLVPVALALLLLERRFVGRRSYGVLGLRRGAPLLPLRGHFGGWATWAAAAAAALSAAPLAALAVRADISAGGIVEVLAWARQAPWNGLVAGAAAATGIAALGLIVGHASARGNRAGAVLDTLSTLAFLTPAAVLGVGLISLWNRPDTRFVYGTLGILVIGYVARYLVVGIRVAASAVMQSPLHFEEAAASFGARFGRRFFRIVLPLHSRAVAFAWLLAMVFCLRDLETAVLFYPPGWEPLTVRIFTLEANGPEPLVAGLALLHTSITAGVVAAGAALFRPGRMT